MLILGMSYGTLVNGSIQVSEILKHQGSLSEAADLVGI